MIKIEVDSMDADEVDDAHDLRDPKIKSQIRQCNKDIRAGRTKPAEYTPAQRRILDARLAQARKGPHYGPFNTADEMISHMKSELKNRATIKSAKRPR
jgi:hypothetical protein